MPYLYHMRPLDMYGDILYPLSALKTIAPSLYTRQIAKYQDHPSRRGLPQRLIPLLNCRWSDVIFCIAIHPHRLYQALHERQLPANPDEVWFQIPLACIDGLRAVIWQGAMTDPEAPLRAEDVAWLDQERDFELHAVPEATLAWYDRLAQTGRVYGKLVGVPHICVQGTIDISRVGIIRWGEPWLE